MPAKWLFKSEPGTYSFSDLIRDGKTTWDGVSNNLALKNLRSVHRGDLVLIYHTGIERSVVGIAEAASEPYPDPKQKDPKLVVVDIAPREKLARPVPLDKIRAGGKRDGSPLAQFDLLRLPRLSVMPVSEAQWKAIIALSDLKQ